MIEYDVTNCGSPKKVPEYEDNNWVSICHTDDVLMNFSEDLLGVPGKVLEYQDNKWGSICHT